MRTRLSLQNLNTFAVAAETLSFQRAAQALHVSPSAVSHQIRSLESQLEYPLFERGDKSIRLTPRGNELYLDIRGAFKQIHEASRKALRGPEDSALALSVAPVFATRWLLPRLRDFRQQHPDITLSVIASSAMADFQHDPFDAAIRMGDGAWPDNVSTRLFDRRIVAACRPELIKRHGGPFPLDQLIRQPLIHNSLMPSLWDEWLNSAGFAPPDTLPGIQVQGISQVMEVIGGDDAIGLVDLSFIQQDLDAGRLSLANDHVLSDGQGFFLTYPQSMQDRNSLHLFEQWLLTQIAQR